MVIPLVVGEISTSLTLLDGNFN